MKRIAVFALLFLLPGLILSGVAGAAAPNPQPPKLGGGGSWSGTVVQYSSTGAVSTVALKLHVATQSGTFFTGTVTIGTGNFTGYGFLEGDNINFYGRTTTGNSLNFYGELFWLPAPRIIETGMYQYTSSGNINYGNAMLNPVP